MGTVWSPQNLLPLLQNGGLINDTTYTQIHRWDTVLPIKRGIRVRGSATVRP